MKKDLENKINTFVLRFPAEFQSLIIDCINFSKTKLSDKKRDSGESYFEHSIDVANLVLDIGLDVNSAIVALLHDTFTVLDDETDLENLRSEIQKKYGDEVLMMLHLLDNISRSTKLTTERSQLTKFILKDCQDLRALLIRLSDKLISARTIEYVQDKDLEDFADNLLKIYSPLAEYLNLYIIKKEFDAIAFKCIYPKEYEQIKSFVDSNKAYNDKILDKTEEQLKKDLNGFVTNYTVFGRIKGPYSIYKKLLKYQDENKSPDLREIKDILAFTILVDSVKDTYIALGAIQNDKTIKITEIEDYIVDPKPNGYSAIHLIVEIENYDINDIIETEIQILTYDMYQINTYGSASHFAYKEQGIRFAKPSDDFEWLRNIRESLPKARSKESILLSEPIVSRVFVDQVFVFTPKGDIVNLPNGSTAIDFAFSIHSDLGLKMIGAKINDKPQGLGTVLNDGDKVEIIMSKNPKSSSKVTETWLKYAITSRARKKIIKELSSKWK